MPFNILLANPIQHPNLAAHRMVPVRFARAVSGFSQSEAPDLDDHGFVLPVNFGSAHGPVAGVMQNETVRVKLIRDRLEPTAELYVTVDDASIAEVVFPSPGSPLSPNNTPAAAGGGADREGDCIYFRGTATGRADQMTKLKVRFGAADSSVILAEMAIRVYRPLTIRVQAHSVSINGVGPTTTLDAIRRLFRRVNAIYAQAGIRFALRPNYMAEAVAGFARNGTVTLTNVADERNVELQTVLRQNSVPNMLNAYFFRNYFDTVTALQNQVLGIAFSRDRARANPPNAATGFPGCQAGITVRDMADPIEAAHTIAHEIGHALRLEHYARGNGSNGTASDQREDIWAHRCLMYNIVGLSAATPAGNRYPSSQARIQVGYGMLGDGATPCTGQLIMTKSIRRISQSDQINVVRRAVRSGSYKPV